jgi:energy-coupling factor transport system ATP-binding protein
VLTNVEIVEKGSLKETSLYHVAQIIGIDNPKDLVDAFVSYEKNERGLS